MTDKEKKSVAVGEKRASGTDDSFLEFHPKNASKLEKVLQIVDQNPTKRKPNMKMPQRSSILDRVKNFLPSIEKANMDLEKRINEHGKEEIDIENVENAEKVIEFDLSLVPDCVDSNNLPEVIKNLIEENPDKMSNSDSENSSEESEREEETLIQEIS